MAKFAMDTEAVQSIANDINLLKKELDSIVTEFSTSNVISSDEFDFTGAMNAIKSNIEYTLEKFENASLYIYTAIAEHTAIQNETKIEQEENDNVPETNTSPINTDGENIIYTIKKGDTLSELARMYGTSISAILACNSYIDDKDLIYTGNKLVIPTGGNNIIPQEKPQESPKANPQTQTPEQPKGNNTEEKTEDSKPKTENTTVDGYTSNEDFPVTIGNKTYNLSQKDMEQLMAIVAAEADNESIDDCLAVVSVILNRCENEWHVNTFGEGPIAQATAPKQFTGYGNSNYYAALGGNVNDNVRQAVTDALNGVRNNDYLYFRSYGSDPEKYGNTMIYKTGNRYF